MEGSNKLETVFFWTVQDCAPVKFACSLLYFFYMQHMLPALYPMNNQICELKAKKQERLGGKGGGALSA